MNAFEWIKLGTNHANAETLAEELAKFTKMVSTEKGWWCRMAINGNKSSSEIDATTPNMRELFGLSDAAVRVLFEAAGMCRLSNFGSLCVHANGIEMF